MSPAAARLAAPSHTPSTSSSHGSPSPEKIHKKPKKIGNNVIIT
jgi:hypothetical protein